RAAPGAARAAHEGRLPRVLRRRPRRTDLQLSRPAPDSRAGRQALGERPTPAGCSADVRGRPVRDPEPMLKRSAVGALGGAAVLGVLAGCGSSANVSQEDLDPAAVIRQAAERSGTASFAFTMDQTMSGERVVADGAYE